MSAGSVAKDDDNENENKDHESIASATVNVTSPDTFSNSNHETPDRDAGTEADNDNDNDSDSDSSDDSEEDEPRLKYSKLTPGLQTVYRNGDATSSLLVTGDKIVIGTHNGNIHTLALPSLQSLRLYHAHSASITAISVSPTPPPPRPPGPRLDRVNSSWRSSSTPLPPSRAPKQQAPVPPTPSNLIHIATASIDGHVCVSSLVDPKDVTLRNFARPVNAVALSPEYKTDRTYLSGGLSGNLILTTGAKPGVSADANTNSAAAAASGWLGSIGLGTNTGKDTVLHSGEGAISTISFSKTGRFVVWVNEHGIKIMRSHLKLEQTESESAWKRIAHVDRPTRKGWDDMAAVWKARVEWIDDDALEADLDVPRAPNASAEDSSKPTKKRLPEKLVVGWGDTAWLIHVHSGRPGHGKHANDRLPGRADILHKLTFDDCVVSGLSLYTPSLLAILAYRTRDDEDNPIPSSVHETPKRGRHHRQTGLQPELRLINVTTSEEVDVDTLNISRFESLSAADYQMASLYIPPAPRIIPIQKGAFESIGTGIWDVGASATRLLASGASIKSPPPSEAGKTSVRSPTSGSGSQVSVSSRKAADSNPFLARAGLKLFISSPYDCVLAIKRELADHLSWLLERKYYGKAWSLIDDHPGIVGVPNDRQSVPSSPSATSSKAQDNTLADFFADDSTSQTTLSPEKAQNAAAAREKQRIGDLWVQQLVSKNDWEAAGKVAGQVLGASSRWEKWVLAFAQEGHFDEITPYIPSTDMKPALPSFVYEVVLGHYIGHDRPRFRELLDRWDPELFDITSVKTAIENKLDSGDVNEETVEGGERGRDWRILLDGLAKLHFAEGRMRDALRCYVRLQNADAAMSLIREYHLADAISDDIPGLLMLRVAREQMKKASLEELEEASSEVVRLLVDEAYSGIVRPNVVVSQLERRGSTYRPFLFFYFRSLWQGQATGDREPMSRADRMKFNQQVDEGRVLVEQFGDLAVSLYAEYDRDLLMQFLRASTSYTYEKASHICEERHYIPELVYLLSKTGQTKRALFLIIGELGDVSQAISFTKENPDLWDDLLDYSMDKPQFIRALLEEVGTSINPITLVRRIPNSLEIEGLREGIGKMIREYEIQHSISDGVAKVLRGEVVTGMDTLRAGQKKAVKFDVTHEKMDEVEVRVDAVPAPNGDFTDDTENAHAPGCCVECRDIFHEDEKETLIGFSCGHVFHLSCLLSSDPEADVKDIETLAAPDAVPAEGGNARSVGEKVEHARRIKRAVRGGCTVCVLPEGAAG